MGYLHGLRPTGELFPEIKSHAYGHGIQEIVQILESFPTLYLVVDSIPEYHRAKKYTHKKFLLQGETNPANYIHLDSKKVTIVVYNIATLRYILDL